MYDLICGLFCKTLAKMPGVSQRYWTASTLQGRRWLMEKRLEAVEQNDMDQLRQLLSAQGRPKPRELTTALEIAVMKKSEEYAECIDILLQHGANVNATNGSGTPFLHLAADAGLILVLSLLIKYKCNLNQVREDGASALHRAAWQGHVDCLRLLLDCGADPDQCDTMGRTPVLTAAQGNRTDCVLVLIKTGCDLTVLDSMGRSVLYSAVEFSNVFLVRHVLQYKLGDVIDAQDTHERTPLMLAARTGDDVMMQLLLSHGADPDVQDADYRTPVMVSAIQRHLACVRLLAAAGCDVNMQDLEKATPLVYILFDSDLVKNIIEAGANPNVKTKQNLTPLWISSSNNIISTVRLLLQAGADPTVTGGYDNVKLPLQVALYDGFLFVTKMMFISSVAMGTDLTWLSGYLADDNLQKQAAEKQSVRDALYWINDVIDQYPANHMMSLKARCRKFLRETIGCIQLFSKLDQLALPRGLKHYLQLEELSSL